MIAMSDDRSIGDHRSCPFCGSSAMFASRRDVNHPCGSDSMNAFDILCAGCTALVRGPAMSDVRAAYDAAYELWDRRSDI